MNSQERNKRRIWLALSLLILAAPPAVADESQDHRAVAAILQSVRECERRSCEAIIVAENPVSTNLMNGSSAIGFDALREANKIISELKLQSQLLETEQSIIAVQAQKTNVPVIETDTTATAHKLDIAILDLDPDCVWQIQKRAPQPWDNVRRDLLVRAKTIESLSQSLSRLEEEIRSTEAKVTADNLAQLGLANGNVTPEYRFGELWRQNIAAIKASTAELREILDQDTLDSKRITAETHKIRFCSNTLNSIVQNLSSGVRRISLGANRVTK